MGIFSKKKTTEENLSEVKRGVIQQSTTQNTRNTQNIPQKAAVNTTVEGQNHNTQPQRPQIPQNNVPQSNNNINLKPPVSSNLGTEKEDISAKNSDSNLDLFDLKDLNIDLDDLENENKKDKRDNEKSEEEFNNKNQGIDLSKYKTENLEQINTDKPIFISTEQFKKVIDNIEIVKSKIKSATDTYIRILDIKSEEDLEFDNLKKDFQNLEEKLYEIDSILFEENGL